MNKKIIISIAVIISLFLIGGLVFNYFYQKKIENIEDEAKNNATKTVEEVFTYSGSENYLDNLEQLKGLLSEEVYKERTSKQSTEQIKKLEEEYGYRVVVVVNDAKLRQQINNLYIYEVTATESTFYDKVAGSEEYSLVLNYEIEIQYVDNQYQVTKILRLDDAGDEE